MMLTEKECREALKDLYNSICELEEIKSGVETTCVFDDSLDCFKELIDQHFDNPPLKFEELKEGMWVWDNKMVLYIRIAKIIGKTIYVEDFLYGFDCYGRYEENRFYRKEVVQE